MIKLETSFNAVGFVYSILILAVVILCLSFYVIAVKMAGNRGRSQFGWFLFALFFSPILAMIFLALLGETDEKRLEKIREEETIRAMYRN